MDQFEVQELIFEVSEYRSDILKNIDQLFRTLKENPQDLAAKKELVNRLKEFTGINQVVLTFKKDYMNAAVIPIYNRNISTDLINLLKILILEMILEICKLLKNRQNISEKYIS